MKRFLILFLFFVQFLYAQNIQTRLEPIKVFSADQAQFFRSLYSHQFFASRQDTVLFVEKTCGLQILQVDSVDVHELQILFQIDSAFVDFNNYQLVVVDKDNSVKANLQLDVIYNKVPQIAAIKIHDNFGNHQDTLCLKPSGKTVATMLLQGSGLFAKSEIIFDDPSIKVINDPGWHYCHAPNELQVGLEISADNIVVGPKSFRVKNAFAIESFGEVFFIGAHNPQFIGRIPGFVADGNIKTLKLKGNHFSPGIRVELVPADGFVYTKFISNNEIQADINLPVLEASSSYRLAIINPDGKTDTTSAFTVRNMPLATAKIFPLDQKKIYLGKTVHTLITVDTRSGFRLSARKSYEVSIEGNSFPITRVVSDSTCEAVIKIFEEKVVGYFNQHVFTVNEAGAAPRWRGLLSSNPAPKISYVSKNRIIHPSDTLSLVIKGSNLKNAVLLIDDPEVIFHVLENRDDLLRVQALAGSDVQPGSYALELRLDEVPFRFNEYRIEVVNWQPFQEYMQFHCSTGGDLPLTQTFQQDDRKHLIQQNEAVTLKINLAAIKEMYGTQKVTIRGVLMDSLNNIRAEAYDNKTLILENQDDTMIWRWRVREKINSGDRIEISLKNPGGHNKCVETFIVKRHWSEAFHGSTSFIVVKMPFGGEQETGVLNNMGLGISYQPFPNANFLEFDGSFIIGKNGEGSIDVGFGTSAILWQHLQIGVGSNLTGKTFHNWYMFLGTRFKISLPF